MLAVEIGLLVNEYQTVLGRRTSKLDVDGPGPQRHPSHVATLTSVVLKRGPVSSSDELTPSRCARRPMPLCRLAVLVDRG